MAISIIWNIAMVISIVFHGLVNGNVNSNCFKCDLSITILILLNVTSSFSIKKLHRVADLWPRHVKWGRPVKNAVHISNLYRPRFWQVDSPEVLLIDGPLLFSIWMASGPHVAMIFYPPFSTTHFFLLISLAYTYAYHRIVISQQRWDPEQHFDVKKQGWSFDKILSTRDSKYMQHFY